LIHTGRDAEVTPQDVVPLPDPEVFWYGNTGSR